MGSARTIVVVILGVFLCAVVAGWALSQRGTLTRVGASSGTTVTSRAFAGDVWWGRYAAEVAESARVDTYPATATRSTTTSRVTEQTTSAVDSLGGTPSTSVPMEQSQDDESSVSETRVGGGIVVAWQPSHQDDTGADSWHEYRICGDIVQRTMGLLSTVENVLAWETGMGLTGSNNNGGTNRPAFDSELAQANGAEPDFFISIHNDGGAPSGVLGMYFLGDQKSAAVAEQLARKVSADTGLPYRGIRGHDLYSLDSVRNHAPVRVLLEIGDNANDRSFLEDPGGRQRIAEALAAGVRSLEVGP